MRVHALLPYPYDTAPSQRYRIEQWELPLRRLGVELHRHHLLTDRETLSGLWRRPPSARSMARLMWSSARQAAGIARTAPPDAWIVHREATLLGPAFLERMAARRAPVVYDFDDALWIASTRGSGWGGVADWFRHPAKTNEILALAAGVSAGNAYLADHARSFSPIVEVVPSTVDLQGTYSPMVDHRSGRPYTIGWMGSHTTAHYLERILPALAEVARDRPFRFIVIGARVAHPGLEIEHREWSASSEVPDLLDLDVGLMPLVEDPWARGKCGMKAIQYMGLGIPPVVSPVGTNSEIVADGENGFLASSDEDWRRAIIALADPALRSRIGAAARRTVADRYSAEVAAERLASLLHRVHQAAVDPRRTAVSIG
jgi:glycosyltransferase involved in cell wall biosynthesis